MDTNERIGLEVRARDLGIDPEGKEDTELTELVEAAEADDDKKNTGTKTKKRRFWRSSQASGLTVHISATETVRFVPYFEKNQGDEIRVGYLDTTDKRANELCEADPNCEEIQKDEFDKATGENSKPAGY